VDYEVLAPRRELLTRFVALLGAASPDSAPERFPSDEDALAYWINAYNAFVLRAVMEEYPIRSVWKAKDGQFFERARHVGGGRAGCPPPTPAAPPWGPAPASRASTSPSTAPPTAARPCGRGPTSRPDS